MDELRCPMCGKNNPAERETCQFCQARLKPMRPGVSGEESGGAAAAPQTGAAADPEASSIPDWLKNIETTKSQRQVEATPEEAPTTGLSWLDDLREDSQSSLRGQTENLPEQVEPTAGEEAPDWLNRIRKRFHTDELKEQTEEAEPEREPEMPAWQASILSVENVEEPGLSPIEEAIPEADPDEIPAWLASFAAPEPDPEPEGGGMGAGRHSIIPPFTFDDTELQALSGEDLPEWLGETFSEEPTELPPIFESSEEDSQITRAVLPDWMAAMRPIEAAVPVFSQPAPERQEDQGPLAGIIGALPGENRATRREPTVKLPPALQITDSQKTHAEVLRQMMDEVEPVRPLRRRRRLSLQNVLRWLIGLTLIAAIVWPLLLDSRQAPLPFPRMETEAVARLVNRLPVDGRVLVAFDFEPSHSAEMETAARGVLEQMMSRGVFLTLVSTSASGALLAEGMIAGVETEFEYLPGYRYVNLGLIPGGAAGLASFAQTPQRAMPVSLDGIPAWQVEGQAGLLPLQRITRLQDFSMVLVITDSVEAARGWIEQVGPQLGEGESATPLVMVGSAQIEPLVRPYYAETGGQVQALLVGVQGGAAYNRMSGHGALPAVYWDAFSAGLLVAALVISVAGLYNLFAGPPSQGQENSGRG